MIQIFGTKKCRDTAKALRFFKERNIQFHLVDLAEKGMSRGELNNVTRIIPVDDLIDRDSKAYEKRNLKYIKHDIFEELLSDAALFRTPVVRYEGKASVGYVPDVWKDWLGK